MSTIQLIQITPEQLQGAIIKGINAKLDELTELQDKAVKELLTLKKGVYSTLSQKEKKVPIPPYIYLEYAHLCPITNIVLDKEKLKEYKRLCLELLRNSKGLTKREKSKTELLAKRNRYYNSYTHGRTVREGVGLNQFNLFNNSKENRNDTRLNKALIEQLRAHTKAFIPLSVMRRGKYLIIYLLLILLSLFRIEPYNRLTFGFYGIYGTESITDTNKSIFLIYINYNKYKATVM